MLGGDRLLHRIYLVMEGISNEAYEGRGRGVGGRKELKGDGTYWLER